MNVVEIPQPEERDWRYRAFEILPGFLTYIILALPVILSIFAPLWAAYFIVIFLLLWFIRAIGLDVRMYQAYRRMEEHKRLDWYKMNDDLETLDIRYKQAPKWHQHN